jgi:hypothetical protein
MADHVKTVRNELTDRRIDRTDRGRMGIDDETIGRETIG